MKFTRELCAQGTKTAAESKRSNRRYRTREVPDGDVIRLRTSPSQFRAPESSAVSKGRAELGGIRWEICNLILVITAGTGLPNPRHPSSKFMAGKNPLVLNSSRAPIEGACLDTGKRGNRSFHRVLPCAKKRKCRTVQDWATKSELSVTRWNQKSASHR